MNVDDVVIATLASLNPVPGRRSEDEADRAAAERILHRVLALEPVAERGRAEARASRRWTVVAGLVSAVVVVAVGAAILSAGRGGRPTAPAAGGVGVTLEATPARPGVAVTPATMGRELRIVRARLAVLADQLGAAPGAIGVTRAGADRLVVTVRGGGAGAARAASMVSSALQAGGELRFYDWEADVLAPDGRAVAAQLASAGPAALLLSQGRGLDEPGSAAAGGLPLYRAVALASMQPSVAGRRSLSRIGPQYYLFGAGGSAACAAVATADGAPSNGSAGGVGSVGSAGTAGSAGSAGTAASAGTASGEGHCLLAGPAATVAEVDQALPVGVTPADGRLVTVPQGTVVLEALGDTAAQFTSPAARFFVLHDAVALPAPQITGARAGRDAGGEPDVVLRLSATGSREFQALTARVARRGETVSVASATLMQHGAVAFGTQLLTVFGIDFREYPDGVIGGGVMDITGGLTERSARNLAGALRLGALPLPLRVVTTG